MDGVDKLFLPILNAPLLSYTLAAFEAVPLVQSITLVLSAANMERGKELVQEHGIGKVNHICLGGERRQDSVRRGLEPLEPYPWVIVHDGARPCAEPRLIERGLDEAVRWGSAVAAVPMKDTVKVAGPERTVRETLDRRRLWATQTPQIFPWELLNQAHQQQDIAATDDSTMVESLGYPVHLYFGSYANIKVTTREDGLIAETLLRHREQLAV